MPELLYHFTKEDRNDKKYWLAAYNFDKNKTKIEELVNEAHIFLKKRMEEEFGGLV